MTNEMSGIARKTKTETVSMKIITLVTLFFLPGTFIAVSLSFFLCLVSAIIAPQSADRPNFFIDVFLYGFTGFFRAIKADQSVAMDFRHL